MFAKCPEIAKYPSNIRQPRYHFRSRMTSEARSASADRRPAPADRKQRRSAIMRRRRLAEEETIMVIVKS